jgi:hypothetical protein
MSNPHLNLKNLDYQETAFPTVGMTSFSINSLKRDVSFCKFSFFIYSDIPIVALSFIIFYSFQSLKFTNSKAHLVVLLMFIESLLST